MADPIAFTNLIKDSFDRTRRLVVPSLPYAAVFILALGALVWSAGALPEGGAGFAAFSAIAFATLYAHSLFSASMYHAVLEHETGLISAAWKLTLAWLLMIVIASIGASIIILFFSLIGSSLGVVSGESSENITDMAAQMREGGTFWPLFALFIATLIGVYWFTARIMTFAAASATRGAVHVLRTWYWTKGQFRVLAPAVGLLIVIPLTLGAFVANLVVSGWVGTEPLSAATSAGLTMLVMLILVPTAWIGHGLAASVYARVAPPLDIDEA
ncbi:MAG: hypothetical protein AAGL11_00075 [Pseudomonadota bacterium]